MREYALRKVLLALLAAASCSWLAAQSQAPQSTGNVWAWGDNGFSELGNGTTVATSTPSQVSSLSGVVAIADGCCDDEFSLSLKSDGTVWAWGGNGFGELGVGTNVPSSTPIAVSSLSGVIAIAAGWDHSLAVKSDGTVWAWGLNANGELGNGSTTNSNTPVQVSNLSGVIAVAAGGSESMALKSDGTMWVWGYNGNGQLGLGTTSAAPVTTPVQISGLSGVVAISAGNGSSLVLKNDGTVWAWGYNLDGRLGNGTTTSSTIPVQTSNLSGVVAISAAGHSLALESDGTVWAWGSNGSGELGNGTTIGSTIPVQVSGLSGTTAIAAGSGYSMAVKSDGTLWAWGFNGQGQLGLGTKGVTPVTTPVQVNSLSGVTGIAAGDIFSLAIQSPADGATTHFSLALPASATAGSAVTLTVTALNASSQIALGYTGTVHFTSTDSHAILPLDYTFTAADNGTHVFSVIFDSTGIQTITVTDAINSAVNSASSITVNPDPTITSLSASANPSVFGQQVSLRALVTPANSSSLTPTGVVTFSDGATQLGTVTLSSGMAIFNTSSLGVGTHSITAAYGGDSNFAPSTSSVFSQVVNQAGTTTSLSASPNPSNFGQPVTLTATIAAVAPGAGSPTGTVTFQDGTIPLSTGTLNSAGNATFSTSSLTSGSHSVTASYSGDSNFLVSTSAPINVTVSLTAIHLAVSAPASAIAGTPFSLTVTALNAANQTLTTYTDTVILSSTDAQAILLPLTYTFTAADQGVHIFTAITLNTPGNQTITATDASNATIKGSSALISVASPPPPVVQITDNETINVSDAESFQDIFDAEPVHVKDAAFVTPLIAVTAPVAEFSVGGLGFGGQSGSQTVAVSGIGQAPLTLASVAISGNSQFTIALISCSNSATSFPTQLPAGGVCTVTINYAASATPANDIASIVFMDNAALSNLATTPSGANYMQSVPLTGEGTNIGPPPPPPAVIPLVDNETVHVADSQSFPDVLDSETITVSDQVTINVISTTTTTSISAPGIPYGTPGSVTVSVTSSGGVPSGSVTLSVDGGIASSVALSGGAATFSLGALNAGSHSLSATFPAQGGFTGSSANSTFVVAQASLTLAANNTAKVYGAPLPALTFSASGFVNGDTVASLTTQPSLSTTATAASGVGSYPISISGAVDSNYSITYVPGTLTVTPAGITITATSVAKVLGSTLPKLAWTTSGFVNGDTTSVFTANPTCTTTAGTTSPVGSYPITCSGASAANYTFSYAPGTLQIQYSASIGHVIQFPINTDGSSVFKQGRTIPATFRVYDANGVSIGTPGVVSSFFLTGIVSGTTSTVVENVVDTNNPDTAFRWDPTAQQWIFNITTATLTAGNTYVYTISLNDGSTIVFQYGLR